MKFEAADPKKGLTVQELKDAADKLVLVLEATGQSLTTPVKAWVNLKAGIKSLEV